MTPFERFFADTFQRELELVLIPREELLYPDRAEPSWDRRAAWLLWCEREGINPDKAKVEPVLTDDGY